MTFAKICEYLFIQKFLEETSCAEKGAAGRAKVTAKADLLALKTRANFPLDHKALCVSNPNERERRGTGACASL